MRFLYTLLFFFSVSIASYAAKACGPSISATLADGRTVTLSLWGDEHLSFYVAEGGELVLRNKDGIYYVASDAQRDSLQAVLTELNHRSMETLRNGASKGVLGSSPRLDYGGATPHEGDVRIPVIMVEFTDSVFRFTRNDVDKLLNSSEYQTSDRFRGYGSASQYFKDCSRGKFSPQFDVYGPYKLNHPSKYYGGGTSSQERIKQVVRDALAQATGDIDFSLYDSDKNAVIDGVCVLYAGWNSNQTLNDDDLWPQSGNDNLGTYGGLSLTRWLACGEILGNKYFYSANDKYALTGIGVFVHEFSHMLGMPDFYPISVSKTAYSQLDNQSMEDWDVMDNGENTQAGLYPIPYSAWEREYMGWNGNMKVLSEPSDVTLVPLMSGGEGLKIINDNDASGNEFYVLEALPSGVKSGWYRYLKGSGMLITHINYKESTFEGINYPNNVIGKPGITIIPADGYLPSSYRIKSNITESYGDYLTQSDYYKQLAGDPYPGTGKVTSFNNYKAYTGYIDKAITEITRNSSDQTVSFKFMGGAVGINNATADTVPSADKAYKTLINGRLVIVKGNEAYTPAGMKCTR